MCMHSSLTTVVLLSELKLCEILWYSQFMWAEIANQISTVNILYAYIAQKRLIF